jgi:dTDP-4-dehydrorhamnose reductase
MRVAIYGSGGMAGHMVSRYLRDQGVDVVDVARQGAELHCDVEDRTTVDSSLAQLGGVDWIINCIGLLVADSNSRPDRAAVVNSWFPKYLEQRTKDSNTRIIHLSTDCVFDGAGGPYVEADRHTETNSYGRSKSYGEINNNKDITFRTSIIGTELKTDGSGLLGWVLAQRGTTVSGYVDAHWNGITTLQLARCIHQHIVHPRATGVYHVVNNSVNTNKYELLRSIDKVWDLGLNIVEAQAPKKVNKILVDTRLEVDWSIPDYPTQLQELYEYTRG